jgi:hypothetical protein
MEEIHRWPIPYGVGGAKLFPSASGHRGGSKDKNHPETCGFGDGFQMK